MPGRFKDYIATPKANLYQSLHTTVIGPDARPIEVQIRTAEMHEHAEYGVAAHWLYKKSGNSQGKMSRDDKSIDSTINHIRRSLDWVSEDDINDPHEFLDDLRVDLFEGEIFVFTPKGEVMSLRRESTPLDFAYAVHTEVGNHCVGAKVNGVGGAADLRSCRSGDRVEILTNKNARPSRDWMNIVQTPSARAKIRKYFATVTKSDDAEQGRSELARELRKAGYGISTQRTTKAIDKVLRQFDDRTVEDLFPAIYTGKASVQVRWPTASRRSWRRAPRAARRQARGGRESRPLEAPRRADSCKVHGLARRQGQEAQEANCGVVVKGDPDLLAHLAHCCNPVAGDDIVGFITRGRGVSVHRATCPNVKGLMQHPERMIEVEWDTSGSTVFQVEIVVEATDRMGLLKDVTIAINDAGANILSAATQTSHAGRGALRFLGRHLRREPARRAARHR